MILRYLSKCTRFASGVRLASFLKDFIFTYPEVLFLFFRIPLNQRPDLLKSIYHKFLSFGLRNRFLKKTSFLSESIFLKSDPVRIILLLNFFRLPTDFCLFLQRCQLLRFLLLMIKNILAAFRKYLFSKRISIYSSRFLQVVFLRSKGIPSKDSFLLPDPSLRLFL